MKVKTQLKAGGCGGSLINVSNNDVAIGAQVGVLSFQAQSTSAN